MKALRFHITHTTTYDYLSPVTVSHHMLRLAPRRLARQFVMAHSLEITPAAAATHRYIDYFGNEVAFTAIEGAHRRLSVTARSQAAVAPSFIPDASETPAWEKVRYLCHTDLSEPVLEASEFMFASPLVPTEAQFRAYAAPSFPARRPVLEGVLDLAARIHGEFKFDAAATAVSTPLTQVLERRHGVCQDFAHLMIACLRALGLPARYVSGYLETLPPPGQSKLLGADASHAWVAFFCPGVGWIDVDPTNNVLPSLQHITLGWGRDYGDVSPIRGVLVGGDEHTLTVAVDVVALGEVEANEGSGTNNAP
ncbi:MAG TPA: transglutaminase family protein [Candidatus Acidoferrum sp.]|nr:transglutaminase family protein [Candidatus Acidoferrum sp.]